MFDLSVTFNLVVFIALCALCVIWLFLDIDLLVAGSIKKGFKIVCIVLGAVGLLLSVIMAAMSAGLAFELMTIQGDVLVISFAGLGLKGWAQFAALTTYTVIHILTAALFALSLLMLICACVKKSLKQSKYAASDLSTASAAQNGADNQDSDKLLSGDSARQEQEIRERPIADVKGIMNEISGLVDSIGSTALFDSMPTDDAEFEEDGQDGESYEDEFADGELTEDGAQVKEDAEQNLEDDAQVEDDAEFEEDGQDGESFEYEFADGALTEDDAQVKEDAEQNLEDDAQVDNDAEQNLEDDAEFEDETEFEEDGQDGESFEDDIYETQAEGVAPLEKQFSESDLERVADAPRVKRNETLEVDEFTVHENSERNAPIFYPMPKVRTIIRPSQRAKKETGGQPEVKEQAKKVIKEEVKEEVKEVQPVENGLPVTKRHVLLNRRNVVNMFSDYLKNKSEDEKERIESAINTIIIK